MAIKPVGINTVLGTSTTSARTLAISQQSQDLRVVAETVGCYVAIGTLPVATEQDFYVAVGEPEEIAIGMPASQRVVGVTTGTTTILDFPEGTGCPFAIGEAVTLTVTGQSALDFSHKIVTDVNTSAGVGGYFSTRITVDHDSSAGPAFNSPYAELRKSIMVAVKSESGSGKAFIQQVQTS